MKVYVGNMPFSMDESQTRTIFEEFGTIDSVNVITDRNTGRHRGFAFVEMDDEGARKAIAELHEGREGVAAQRLEEQAKEFLERGQKSLAKVFYTQIKTRYPQTEAAKRAEEALSKLN